MKLHEYQAKKLFADYGIPVQRGIVASTPEQAGKAFTKLKTLLKGSSLFEARSAKKGGKSFQSNVKVQIHAGGRGKAGGVQAASSSKDARDKSKQLLGRRLVTHQTGSEGLPVTRVLIDERVTPSRELYFAITYDRASACPALLVSRQGGVEIEAVAAKDPQAIVKELIDPVVGVTAFQVRRLQAALGITGAFAKPFHQLVPAVYRCFLESDASLIEVNPLVETADDRLIALDGKIVIDDNALFRQPALARLRDKGQEHPLEYLASQVGISYVGLEGNIGCLVNGAGLAMATNDIITLYGGKPANFLDVGGGANVEQVTKAFTIILADTRVTAILVNIFGGIMRCDWIAQGLINATKSIRTGFRRDTLKQHVPSEPGTVVPLVVRLAGTNVEEGRKLLKESGLKITAANDLAEAAQTVVKLAGGAAAKR